MSDLKVKFQLLRENAQLPKKAHDDDACFDVFISEIVYPDSMGECYRLKLGFKTEIPKGYKGVLVPRSSITKEYFYMPNSPGQIDSGFRNEWEMRMRAIPYVVNYGFIEWPEFPFKIGDRIGQIYFEKVLDVEFDVIEELGDSERGEGGFGSTGK